MLWYRIGNKIFICFQISNAIFLAVQLLGTREHRLRCISVQTNYAKQNATRAGRLRGRESSTIAENVFTQMGIYIYAGKLQASLICFKEIRKNIFMKILFHIKAEAQSKVDKKRDKLERKVLDSQERAFWDVHRPMPGCVNTTEMDIKKAYRRGASSHGSGSSGAAVNSNPIEQINRLIALRKLKLERRTIKVSKVAES